MGYRLVACLLIAISTLGAQASAQEAPSAHEKDVAVLRSAILKSAESFNKGDADAIMAPYAKDIVLSYPGLPDLGYDELVKSYREMVNRPPGVTVHTTPTIEEILVSGDLALIRVMWTTTTTETNPPRQATRRLKDFQALEAGERRHVEVRAGNALPDPRSDPAFLRIGETWSSSLGITAKRRREASGQKMDPATRHPDSLLRWLTSR